MRKVIQLINHARYRLTRRYNQLYALVWGYFWLPCPLCGEPFGGHEWTKPEQFMWIEYGRGRGVCPKASCIEKAKLHNKMTEESKWWKDAEDQAFKRYFPNSIINFPDIGPHL